MISLFPIVNRQSLQGKENDIKKELHRVMQALKAYKSIGMGFEELVQLYGDIIAEIDNKKWALTELRQNDSNDLNDLWKWSFSVYSYYLYGLITSFDHFDTYVTNIRFNG